MKKPKLNPNQFAVGQAEYSTGHVLNVVKTIHHQNGEVYLVFESKDEALTYIKNTLIENPNIECWMENSLGEFVITIDINGERDYNASGNMDME